MNYRYKGKKGDTFTNEILLDDIAEGSSIMLVIYAKIDGQEMCTSQANLQVFPNKEKK